MFHNAQEFYEHLDDCVLRVVQQEEPSEAINEQRLAEVADDPAVQRSLKRPNPAAPHQHEQEQGDLHENNDGANELKEEVTEFAWQQIAHANSHPNDESSSTAPGTSS